MSSYKSFAIAGAGNIGTRIVQALLEKGVSVVILARALKEVPSGATIAVVDYSNVPSLTTTLKENNVDVVISTLSLQGLDAQLPLANAAKAAGVHLFVPSEFSGPTEGAKDPLIANRDELVKHLVAIDLPYARIYSGWFMGFILWGAGITDTGNVHVVGTGSAPLSVTAEEDIAGFVAHILTTLPPTEIVNKAFRIEGDRTTLRDIAALFNKPIIVHDGLPPELSQLHGQFLAFGETGAVSTGYDHVTKKDLGTAGEANALWPGHHWKTIREYYNL